MKKTFCLNMIVKNEAHIIIDCLTNMLPYIDCYCIIDTGSTDQTVDLIRDFFQGRGIEGKVVVHDFANCQCHEKQYSFFHFGLNRSYAITSAAGMSDYLFVMDADDRVTGDLDLTHLPEADNYHLKLKSGSIHYYRPLIFRNDPSFGYRFDGPIHEYLRADKHTKVHNIAGDYIIESRREGDRSKCVDKYLKDALICEEYLKTAKPNDSAYNIPRYLFYCAQSWRDHGEFTKAIQYYILRTKVPGGFEEERYYSYMMLVQLYEKEGRDWMEIESIIFESLKFSPQRCETIYYLVTHLNRIGQYQRAYEMGLKVVGFSYPEHGLFVEKWIYDYGMKFEFAKSAFHIGEIGTALCWYQKLIDLNILPLELSKQIAEQITICQSRLNQTEKPVCAFYFGDQVVNQSLFQQLQANYQVIGIGRHQELPILSIPATNGQIGKCRFDVCVFWNEIPKHLPSLIKKQATYLITSDGQAPKLTFEYGVSLELRESESIQKELRYVAGWYALESNFWGCPVYRGQLLRPMTLGQWGESGAVDRLVKSEMINSFDQSVRTAPVQELVKWAKMEKNGTFYGYELSQIFQLLFDFYEKYREYNLMNLELVYLQSRQLVGQNKLYEANQLLAHWNLLAIPDRVILCLETQKYPKQKIKKLMTPLPNTSRPELSQKKPKAFEKKAATVVVIRHSQSLETFQTTVNSFLTCCQDAHLVKKWVVVGSGSDGVKELIARDYPLFEYHQTPEIVETIYDVAMEYDYLVYFDDCWHFWQENSYIQSSIDILESNAKYLQVVFNRNTSRGGDISIEGGQLIRPKKGPDYVIHEYLPMGSYVRALAQPSKANDISFWPHFTFFPSLIRVAAFQQIGRFIRQGNYEHFYAREAASLGWKMTSFNTLAGKLIGKNVSYTRTIAHFPMVVITTRVHTPVWKEFKNHHRHLEYQVFTPVFVQRNNAKHPKTVAELQEEMRVQVIEQLLEKYSNQTILVLRDNVRLEVDAPDELSRQLQSIEIGVNEIIPLFAPDKSIVKLSAFFVHIQSTRLIDYRIRVDCQMDLQIRDLGTESVFQIDEELQQPLEITGYRFYAGLDSFGNDISHQPLLELARSERIAKWRQANPVAFNTLGYIKSSVNQTLINLPYCESIADGIYVSDQKQS